MNGEELKQVRLRLGMTQEELGRELDIPQATISRWESGTHKIEHDTMLQWAMAAIELKRFDVETGELLKDGHDG